MDIHGAKFLDGQHAVVTGGAKGIGLAVSSALAAAGATVTLMGRDIDVARREAEKLAETHSVKTYAQRLDVADSQSVEDAFQAARDAAGPVSILVNNAGIAKAAPFLRTSREMWDQIIGVDLTGVFLCTHQVLPGMIDQGFGRIVNVGSTASHLGLPYVSAYCAAKHGLLGFTRSLAVEIAKTGVTVNAVCPGYTDTEIVSGAISNIVAKTGKSEEQALKSLTSHNPQGRLIEPQEVANAVSWLCQQNSSSITGQSIAIAGGEITL